MSDDERPLFEGQLVTKGYGQGDQQLIGALLMTALWAIGTVLLFIL